MKKPCVTFNLAIVAGAESAEPADPSNRSFNDPPFSISPKFSSILMGGIPIVTSCRNDRFNATLHQNRTSPVAIVATVGNEPFGVLPRPTGSMRATYRYGVQRLLKELYLRRGRRVQVCSQRSTRAIDQNHPLCALAPFGWADSTPPFLAGAKLPSQKHSSHLILPRSESSARKALQSFSNVPSFSHCCSLLQHVLGEVYRGGSSLHGAPVHNIHKIPSKHRRSLAGGRPPFLFRRRGGRWGRTFSHCFSVNCLHAMLAYYHNPLIYKNLN